MKVLVPDRFHGIDAEMEKKRIESMVENFRDVTTTVFLLTAVLKS
jgi:hypothetical protein